MKKDVSNIIDNINKIVADASKSIVDTATSVSKDYLAADTSLKNYVDDENIKIEIHQMINEIDSYDKLQQIKNVLEDRFGKITLEMEDYMYEEWFEKIAQKYNITQIRQTDRFIEIVLPEKLSSNVKGDKLLLNALSISRNFSFAFRHNQIIITLKYANLKEHFIRYIVRLLNTIN